MDSYSIHLLTASNKGGGRCIGCAESANGEEMEAQADGYTLNAKRVLLALSSEYQVR